jgi:hypothetical protein
MQLTAFGAQDRGFFDVIPCRTPRPQLMGRPLGGQAKNVVSKSGSIAHRGGCLVVRLFSIRGQCLGS